MTFLSFCVFTSFMGAAFSSHVLLQEGVQYLIK
jgi:hypothetical protein